ncbi:MAG: DNA polymerase III subunit delta [Flavobacteriales bacterium]|nr:DNA polymerase III subunit delta [Flavobacteriales bacterium]
MNEYNKIIAKINNDEFFPIYILVGDENYFADNIIKLLTSKVVNNDSKDFDYFKFYGNEISEDQVIDAAKRFPLVGEYNFVVLKDAKSISKNFDKLTSYVESPNLKTILVLSFINQSLDKRKRIYSLSKKNGLAFESKKIYDNQIFNWINEVSLNKRIKLHPKSIQIIIDFVGNNLSQIENELDKLKINSEKDDVIRPDEVESIIGFSKEYNFFELTKHIGKKNFSKTIEIIEYMSTNSNKYPLTLLISSVFYFFNKLFLYHSVENKREASKIMGVNPYFIEEYKLASPNYSMKDISKIFNYLLEADKRAKGIDFDSTNYHAISSELIYKIFNSN